MSGSKVTRKVAGPIVMGLGVLLAVIVAFALVLVDFRVASLAPAAQRSEVLAHGVKVSLLWAGGSGAVVVAIGFGLWLRARRD